MVTTFEESKDVRCLRSFVDNKKGLLPADHFDLVLQSEVALEGFYFCESTGSFRHTGGTMEFLRPGFLAGSSLA